MRKRIVHISKVTGIHGSEKHLMDLLAGLNRDLYEPIAVVLCEPDNPMTQYCKLLGNSGIQVYTVIIRRDADPRCLWDLFWLMKKLRPALVHTHLIHGDAYGIAAARMAGVSHLVSTKHNDDDFRRSRGVGRLNVMLNSRTDKIIAISHWVAQFVERVERVPREKIATIHYGLGALRPARDARAVRDEFGFDNRDVVVGIVARLIKQKGHRTLLDAFGRAHAEDPRLRLLIAGDGELKDCLQRMAEAQGLAPFVRFAGYRRDVADVLEGLDVFVHPSLWEGFGLAILEAMAMGKPIVATDVSAIPELIEDGVSGCLVPPDDSGSLGRALSAVAADAGLRIRLGRAARQRWKACFSLGTMLQKTESLYGGLLDH